MSWIEELELLTRDKTKNFLLQMIEEGWEKGRDEGREEGREEGRDEGRDEHLYEVAKKMVIRGKSTDEICDLLDVSADYVHRLRREMK